MSLRLALAAASAAFLFSPVAQAASSASASLSNFGVTLFDLAPEDGIDASIAFSSNDFNGYGSYVSTSTLDTASASQAGEAWSLTPFGPASSSSTAGGAAATASVGGSLGSGGVSFTASGSAAGAALEGFSTSFNALARSGFYGLSFELSPFTLAIFTATANVAAQTTRGLDQNFITEVASASVNLILGGVGSSGSGYQSSQDGVSVVASFNYVYDPETGTDDYVGETFALSDVALSASFLNYSSGALLGGVDVYAGVDGFSPITAVPEPATVVLFLAGLAAVGGMARRRNV